ncbi:hypothetical protein PV387_43250 [Streptomyces sp. ME02-6987-2C]|uniref:hypothetical protein n=1 Tax=unclassified Streptomyces TaxID=2593676 RepID=UPI0029A6113F|nr:MULTISPECIES: hypothetical protein [unclassified Streptomyces]MDX3345962.1 hypothetical protein [Streptomyces sp. ME02-6979A]MDX3372691.1 hypothetical protein [Streptomyces sp. ME02-6987-2C]MDX3412617.1 hypothetical protein [Streptomyces sp. ME02-6977A]MDX3421728.1 hypothetical protein [Streptomyces sp. ME02-6985-2c]
MQLHETPILDEHWEGEELARDDTHRYVWIWQGSNIRLLAIPDTPDGDWSYNHGWCYPRDPELVAQAVADWDPDTQDEPMGWHKRPTWPVRQAPRRNDNPQYNRARCEHGSYFLNDGCRVLNCRDIREHEDRARSTVRGTA